jgi:succinate dehydrogenase hydrophobic anchor subunit
MLRLAAALLVRLGLVMLILAVLVRLVPMPDRADVMADDFAIVISLVLVLTASIHLRLTRERRQK